MIQLGAILAFLAVGALLLLGNLGERYRRVRVLSFAVSAGLATTMLAVSSSLIAFASLAFLRRAVSAADLRMNVSLLLPIAIAGALSLVYLVPSVQRAVTRWIPLRPGSPVDYAAVVLALMLLGFQIGTQLSVDVLSALASAPPLTEGDLLTEEIPLVVIALLGVGLFVRRPLPETMRRLGLVFPPSIWWWVVALVGIAVFYGVGLGIDRVADVLTPGTQKRVTDVSNVLFRRFDNLGAILLLGTAAGVSEEILFRGAMLPRFGLLLTAVFFAAVHTQYALTFASLEVFVLGLMLGWLRLRAGTIACMVTHAGYDIVVGLVGLIH